MLMLKHSSSSWKGQTDLLDLVSLRRVMKAMQGVLGVKRGMRTHVPGEKWIRSLSREVESIEGLLCPTQPLRF